MESNRLNMKQIISEHIGATKSNWINLNKLELNRPTSDQAESIWRAYTSHIESNRTTSNRIKSNQVKIESNQITSNQTTWNRINSHHSESHHINSNQVESTQIDWNPMKKYDYSREGRTNSIKVAIIDERGEKSVPKSLQMAPRDPLRILRKTMSTELWDRAGSARLDFRQYRTECHFMSFGDRRQTRGRAQPLDPEI